MPHLWFLAILLAQGPENRIQISVNRRRGTWLCRYSCALHHRLWSGRRPQLQVRGVERVKGLQGLGFRVLGFIRLRVYKV